MHGGLFGVGIIAVLIGLVLLALGLSGEVSAVALVLRIILMAIAVLI